MNDCVIFVLIYLYFIKIGIVQSGLPSESFYMKINPQSKEVEEGSPTLFSCLVLPNKGVIYRWMKSGIDGFISYNFHHYLDRTNNRTLHFDHVDRHIDAGQYYCVANNATTTFSIRSSTALLQVYYMDPILKITLKTPSNPSLIKLGTEVKLSCYVDANPKLTKNSISWFFNGKSNLPEHTEILQDGSLQIKSITDKHNGFYHCHIVHAAGKLDSIYPFVIDTGSSINMKEIDSFSLYETKDSAVTLKCPWSGDKIVWSKFQRLGDPFTMISEKDEDTKIQPNGHLLIERMNKETDSFYICQLLNNKDIREAVFRVSLATMYDFVTKDFSPSLEASDPLVIKEGDTGYIRYYKDFSPSLSHIFNEIPNPFPKITWTLNNKKIPDFSEDSEEQQMKYVFDGRHLILEKATQADRGIYVIQMENKAGKRARAFRIEVAFKPEFRKFTELKIVKSENEDIVLNCGIIRMSEQGLSTVYWKKDNGRPLLNKYDNIQFEDNRQTLRIIRAKPENSGRYQCFVRTIKYPELGNDPITILVKAKLQFIGGYKSRDIFMENAEPGEIPCRTKGFGEISTNWYKLIQTNGPFDKNNLRPISSNSGSIKVLDNGSLRFEKVSEIHEGAYVCEAWSKETNEKINKTLFVKVGERARITKISTNATVLEGSNVYLHCQAVGDPDPKIIWIIKSPLYAKPKYINYKPNMKEDDPLKDRIRKLKNGTLVIERVSLNDDALYTCVANNYKLLSTEKVVSVKVLTTEEYAKFLKGDDNGQLNRGIVKTVIIVVSCAITYLALIIGLTVVCSLRMIRNKRNRAMNDKLGSENRQLISRPGAGSNSTTRNGGGGGGMLPHTTQSSIGIGGTTSKPLLYSTSSTGGCGIGITTAPQSSATQNYLPQIPPQISSSNHTPNSYYTQYVDANHNNTTSPIFYPPLHNNLISAPPTTPLESRSTNSASMYTRSHFSSSTNGGGATTTAAGPNAIGVSSMERLTYPRHELQTEVFLGKGEFGEVLLARARNIQEGESQSLVVVKSLILYPPSNTTAGANNPASGGVTSSIDQHPSNPGLCHEFHRQLDMLARVDSDYVTKLLGICIEQDPCLLILEYCEWGDLKQFLRCLRERSNPNMPNIGYGQRLSFCIQIATGMEAIASQNCVHKDLSARNILITPQLHVKVTHLGLSRDGYHADYYQDGDRLLPLRWMSPESIIRGEFSPPSDVWSFAVTVWEIFSSTNQSPIHKYTHEEILDLLASYCTPVHHTTPSPRLVELYQSNERLDQLPAPHSINENSPIKLNNLIKRCLSFDPMTRPSFGDILQEFKVFMNETKV